MAMSGGGGGGGNGAAIEAGRAVVRMTADDAGLRSGLDKGRRMVLSFAKTIAGVGAGLFAAGGGVLGGIGGLFSGAVEKFDAVKKAADRLGTSAETISELGYAARVSGSSLEEMESAAKFLNKNLAMNADTFEQFGINAEKLKGMELGEQFEVIADAIAGMDKEMRTGAATTLLGRSGDRLLPLLKDGAAGLRALRKEAKSVGESIGGKDAANAERAGDAIDRAWTSAKNTFLAVGAALLPQVDRIEQVSAAIVRGVGYVREFITENRQLVLIITAVAAGIAGAGAVLIGLGTALAVGAFAVGGLVSGLTAVATVISTIWAWLPTIAIVGGIAAAVAGLGYVLYKFTPIGEHVRGLFREIGRIAQWAFGIVSTAWEGISAAFQAGDFAGALDIARATLEVFWAALKVGAQTAWNAVANTAEGAWLDIDAAGKKLLVDLKTETQIFGTDMEGYLKGIWKGIWAFYVDGWKNAFKAVVGMLGALLKSEIEMQKAKFKLLADIAKNPDRFLGGAGSIFNPFVSSGKSAVDAAAEEAGKGKALADALGAKTAQDLIRAKGEELKAQIDAVKEAKKKAMIEKRGAELAAALAELEAKEKVLQEKVNVAKSKAIEDNMTDEFIYGNYVKPAMAIAGLSDLVQGQFGGANAGARLGGMHKSKELTTLEAMDDKLGNIEKKVGGIIAA